METTEFTPIQSNNTSNNQSEQKFQTFLSICPKCKEETDLLLVKKAFDFAQTAYKMHHIANSDEILSDALDVAKIITNQIGLGAKSISCVLLKDVIRETPLTTEDIRFNFGEKIAFISENIGNINKKIEIGTGHQSEILREIILNLSDDIRVVFIKLAESLDKARKIEKYERIKQIKFIDKIKKIYAPLAHRLGLYSIKTELEDRWLKFTHPKIYQKLAEKMKGSEQQRTLFINRFSLPLINELSKLGIDFDVAGRPKSIYSVWNKMQKKNIGFDEVFDLFAIRLIYTPRNPDNEADEAWKIYSIIKNKYNIHPDRIRDWISTPKQNGYEALHLTVMSKSGQWVEIQVRSKRMDEVAEFGLASHWKYKGVKDKKTELDNWVKEIKRKLESNKNEDIQFLDEFKVAAFSDQINVFTPKGQIISLPNNATVLDFAFEIHTDLAYKCIGAKVNQKLEAIEHHLRSGDQIEILTSHNQQPEYSWHSVVTTPKAKAGLKEFFKHKRKSLINSGIKTLNDVFDNQNVQNQAPAIRKLLKTLEIKSKEDLYLQIGTQKIDKNIITDALNKRSRNKLIKYWQLQLNNSTTPPKSTSVTNTKVEEKTIDLKSNIDPADFTAAACCNPIPGDPVMAYISPQNKIVLHKENCQTALNILDKYPERLASATWKSSKLLSFLAILNLKGTDSVGLLSKIINLISKDFNINIRNICFDTTNGIFEGKIELYVHDSNDLENIISQLSKIKGIRKVSRK